MCEPPQPVPRSCANPAGRGLSQIPGVDSWVGMAANFVAPDRSDSMSLSAIAEKLKRRSKDDFKGRHFEASLAAAQSSTAPAAFAAALVPCSGFTHQTALIAEP